MFQTLGHIVHHVQDMAQPEHVRNDQHILGLDTSYFEQYTDDRRSRAVVGNDGRFISLLQSGGYPVPEFATAREYWTTRDTDLLMADRRGIADFTNSNFVSKDTNFEIDNGVPSVNRRYSQPVLGTIRSESLTALLGDGGSTCQKLIDQGPLDIPVGYDCQIDLVESAITDNLNPSWSRINPRTSSLSVFDAYLDAYNVDQISYSTDELHLVDIDRVPVLNRFNFDEMHKDLIPRAISFSAGVINRFFKGRIDFSDNSVGDIQARHVPFRMWLPDVYEGSPSIVIA